MISRLTRTFGQVVLTPACHKLVIPTCAYATGTESPLSSDSSTIKSSCYGQKHVQCWKCEHYLDCKADKFFCGQCRYIQPPVKCVNYFQYLDAPISYDLDSSRLSQHYKKLQWQLHPDRFSNRSKEEKDFSEEQSSMVNRAYWTLAKPYSRALYLLKLNGKGLTEEFTHVDPEFLVELMELSEKVNENLTDVGEMREIHEEVKQILADYELEMSRLFLRNDFAAAQEVAARMSYYARLSDTLEDKIEGTAS